MVISFEAELVECTEAIGGDILQVTFDSVDMEDEYERRSPYVLLGQCFEFPGPPSIEWHDGTEYGGGAEIVSVVLDRNSVWIVTDTGPHMDVSFSVSEAQYKELASFLQKIFVKIDVRDRP